MQTAMKCEPTDIRPATGSHAGRRKLWQIDRSYHDSLIGTCLSPLELKALGRKLKIPGLDPAKEAARQSLVEVASEPSPAARRLHKHLDRKFWPTILRFTGAHSTAALVLLWQETATSGERAGAYWALATHPQVSDTLLARAREEVCNPLPVTGYEHRSVTTGTTPGTQIAKREFAPGRRQGRRTLPETAAGDLDEVREQLATLERESLALRLRKQVEDYAALLAGERLRAERAEARASEWKQLANLKAEREALETMLEQVLLEDCSTCRKRDDCLAGINLSGRCILFVGGGTRKCAHFHALVERQNGHFVHHDGDLNGDSTTLGSVLPRADVVFCPLDSVSHEAVDRVRQFCSRHEKQLVMLPSASLAAFTRGLHELAA